MGVSTMTQRVLFLLKIMTDLVAQHTRYQNKDSPQQLLQLSYWLACVLMKDWHAVPIKTWHKAGQAPAQGDVRKVQLNASCILYVRMLKEVDTVDTALAANMKSD